LKIKNWLAGAVVASLLGGLLLVGVPAVKAFAAGNQSGGKAGQGYGLQMGRNYGSMSTNVAEFLGISQEDLQAARQSGQSMVQIAAENSKSEQALVDYVIGQRSDLLDQLVSDGRITQEQADQRIQQMAEQVKENLNRTEIGPNPSGSAAGKGNRAAGECTGAGMGKALGSGQGNGGGNTGAGAGLGNGSGAGQGNGSGQGLCARDGTGTGVCTQNNTAR
jgi:gas vesicle protein